MTTFSAAERAKFELMGLGFTAAQAQYMVTLFGASASTITGNLTVTGTEHVTGAVTLDAAATVGTTLGVTGATTLSDALEVVGAATLDSTLAVTGAVTASAGVKSALHVGVAATGSTAVEYGDGFNHVTVLTVSTTLPAIAGGAALGVGKLLYTLPAGAQVINSAYMSMAITQTQGHINANTPDVGLGSVIAVGAVSVLDGTGTFEDILTGVAAANCTGTPSVSTATPTAGVPLIAAAGSKAVYFNAAATWAASGDAAAILAGTVVLNWQFMH